MSADEPASTRLVGVMYDGAVRRYRVGAQTTFKELAEAATRSFGCLAGTYGLARGPTFRDEELVVPYADAPGVFVLVDRVRAARRQWACSRCQTPNAGSSTRCVICSVPRRALI
jgi:hypothetical protein